MKSIKTVIFNCFCIACLLAVTSCGRRLEDIELDSAEDICSYMNKKDAADYLR